MVAGGHEIINELNQVLINCVNPSPSAIRQLSYSTGEHRASAFNTIFMWGAISTLIVLAEGILSYRHVRHRHLQFQQQRGAIELLPTAERPTELERLAARQDMSRVWPDTVYHMGGVFRNAALSFVLIFVVSFIMARKESAIFEAFARLQSCGNLIPSEDVLQRMHTYVDENMSVPLWISFITTVLMSLMAFVETVNALINAPIYRSLLTPRQG
jgi:hypothetical protein